MQKNMPEPIVLKCGSRTAIALKVSNERYAFIAMHDETLRLEYRSWGDIEHTGYVPFDYDAAKAASLFLQHSAGVTPEAEYLLRHVAGQQPEEEHQEMTIEALLERNNELLEQILAQLKTTAPASDKPAATQKKGKATAAAAEPAKTEPTEPAFEEDTAAPVTLDSLRTLFGQATEAGKKDEAVKVFTSRGFNGVGKATEDKFAEIDAALRALLA